MRDLSWAIKEAENMSSDPGTIHNFLQESLEILESDAKKRIGWVEEDNAVAPYIIVGDLHGDLESLKKILLRINEKPVIKGELKIVFLGDYVDRGPRQLETLLAVLRLKIKFPESIILLRGNHEPPPGLIPYPHDFPEELRMRFGYSKGSELYSEFFQLFQRLPSALYIRKNALMLHGGLPTENYEKEVTLHEYLMGRSPNEAQKVLTEILWNDPVESNVPRTPSPRGAGYLFGKPVTQWVLKKFKIKAVFRAHEPVDLGFKFNHSKRVITLFSRLGPPYFNRKAAYIVIDMLLEEWWEKLRGFIVNFS